jgi:hypothetical protein
MLSNLRKHLPWLLLVGILLVATWILTVGQGVRAFPNDDNVIYAVIAKFWAQGELPYRDLVDHKPPGIYIFYRWCFWMWGLEPAAIWKGFIALTGIATALLVWAFALSNFGPAGLGIGISFGLFFLTDPFVLREGAFLNTEQLASACLALALALTVIYQHARRLLYIFLAGCLFGCACITKQPASMFGMAFVLHILCITWRKPFSTLARTFLTALCTFGIGTLIPAGLVISWYAYQGALHDLIFWVHTANMSYTGVLGSTLESLLSILREHKLIALQHLHQPLALQFLIALYLVPILAILRRSWLDVVIVSWFAGAIAAAALNKQTAHTHYLVFYQVPVALAVGGAFHSLNLISGRFKWSTWRTAMLAVVATIFVFTKDLTTLKSQTLQAWEHAPQTTPLVFQQEFINTMNQATSGRSESDTIFFLGTTPMALFYSSLRPASQYIYQPPFGTISIEDFYKNLIEDITAKKPAVAFVQNYRDTTFAPERSDIQGEFSRCFLEHFEPWFWGANGRIYKRKGLTP